MTPGSIASKMDHLYTCLREDLKALVDAGYLPMDDAREIRILLVRARRKINAEPLPGRPRS